MSGDGTKRNRTAWEVMREELLQPIAVQLRPSVAGMTGLEDGEVIELSFQELSKRTICESFPRGLDFSSDPGSHRRSRTALARETCIMNRRLTAIVEREGDG